MGFFKKYVGNKAFYREMLTVAFPIALQQLVSALVNLLDSAMIGRWGNATLGAGGSEITSAAIMIANRYFTTFDAIMIMTVISCTIFIAQFFGAKNKEKGKKTFGFALQLSIGFGLAAAIIGFVFREPIIYFFSTGVGSGAEMLHYGEQYLSIIALTFIPYSISVAISFCLRSTNKPKVPLLASGAAALTNFVFNYLFIYTFNMGVYGAGIATMISRLVELAILLWYYFKHKPFFFGSFKEIFAKEKGFKKEIILRGMPMAAAQVLTEAMAIFMFFAYAQIDSGNASNIAAVNMSSRVVDIVTAFVGGMGTAAAIMVGMRLGAGKIEEAKQNARWQIGYVVALSLITVLIMICLIPFVQLINNFQPETATLLAVIMIIHAVSLPFMFYSVNVIFITRSGGYTKAPFIITNLPYLFIKIPLVTLFVFIAPGLFENSTFLHQSLAVFGLPANLVIFIFLIDRLIEIVRAVIAYFVLHKAEWLGNLSGHKKEVELVTEVEPPLD